MPANSFQITISAVDRATATIRKINDSMSKVTRPFEEVGKSFKSLGREIGVDKIGKNLSKIGATARDAASSVGRIVAPLAGITGIASVAGIVHLADSWANLGRNITYTSRSIGIGTTQLQEFQGAARLAGLSGDAMGQSLASLGDTMQDAVYGRNQQALMLFDRLTGGVKRNKNGTMDVAGEYKALAAKIYSYKGNPQVQRLIAKHFGLTSMLPLIQQGPKAMKQYMAELKKIGAIMTPAQIANGNKFALSLMEIESAGNGLKYSIGNALIPALKPLVDELTAWISKNRDLISTDVGDWVRDFAKWIKSVNWKEIGGDITAFIKGVENVVHALGGVKKILIEIAAIKALSFAASAATGLVNIFALTKAMKELRKASLLAAKAAEVAAAAGGIPGKAAGVAAEAEGGAGLLSKFGWLGGLLRGAMWAPRPAESPEQFRQHLKKAGIYGPGKESYWQKWGDVFHWRTPAPAGIASHPSMRPQIGLAKGVSPTGAIPRGIRNNNPGNIKYGAFAARMGATGADSGGFAIFPNAQQGINAIGANLRSYGRKGFDTPLEIAHRWSTTDQSAYTKHLADLFGGDPNKPLDMNDPKVIAALSNGIITQENGSNPYAAQSGPYTAGVAKSADHKVQVAVQVTGLPPGTTAKVNTSGATVATARVSYSTVGAMA